MTRWLIVTIIATEISFWRWRAEGPISPVLGHPYHILAKLPCTDAFNVARWLMPTGWWLTIICYNVKLKDKFSGLNVWDLNFWLLCVSLFFQQPWHLTRGRVRRNPPSTMWWHGSTPSTSTSASMACKYTLSHVFSCVDVLFSFSHSFDHVLGTFKAYTWGGVAVAPRNISRAVQ